MICKKCNGEIRPSDEHCPRCGTLVQWEGGNGFWDMAGQLRPVPVTPPVEPQNPAKEEPPKKIVPFTPVLLTLSLLLLLMLFAKSAQLRKAEQRIDDLTEKVEQQRMEVLPAKPEETASPAPATPTAVPEEQNEDEAPEEQDKDGDLSLQGQQRKEEFENRQENGDGSVTPQTPAPADSQTPEQPGDTTGDNND